jgi:hypothetical protein
MLDDWITALAQELGVEPAVDVPALLDTARDAAHQVARPAAPITTFLIGYAAAAHGGGEAVVADMCRSATRLARSWQPAPEA